MKLNMIDATDEKFRIETGSVGLAQSLLPGRLLNKDDVG
jgi:hypothetical protein